MGFKKLILDRCRCSDCGGKFHVDKLEVGIESEGWEYEPYKFHICPNFEEGGCIDDFWPSSKALREHKKGSRYWLRIDWE